MRPKTENSKISIQRKLEVTKKMIRREMLEEKQIWIYLIVIFLSAFFGSNWSNSHILEKAIEPIIAVLLYSMFCQIPFLKLKNAFSNHSFFKALLFGNFILNPLFVWLLISIFPTNPVIIVGVLLVLLTPCIDYVIVFTHLGKGDSESILAATPMLFIFQMLLLPLYLWVFLGKETTSIIEITPFLKSFIYLIVIPFILSILTQISSKSNSAGKAMLNFSGWLPVPFMALTFFVIITSQISVLTNNPKPILSVLPIYAAFAIGAPFIGKLSSKIFKTNTYSARAVSFSTSTRNSLVVLPLALSLPAPSNQLVAAVIVTQTVVEVFFELLYIKVIPFIHPDKKQIT